MISNYLATHTRLRFGVFRKLNACVFFSNLMLSSLVDGYQKTTLESVYA